MAAVLWLDEIGEEDHGRVGGKAFVLARLRRAGLPVPDGFVLTAEAAPIDGARREALAAAYRRLGGVVAVRSSSTAEDLAEASFAGQYRTVLDVRGEDHVVEAARACLDSATDGAPYARAVAAAEGGAMAVLVQRFVEPGSAGVAFTRDPRDPGSLLVESHPGRGEALVSGRVTPDRYAIDRDTGARRGGEGVSLDAGSLAAVVRLARRVEELLGAPQDVEWAIGPEGIALLQARPITVEAEEGDPGARLLTRANVGEVLPDPVTPLTWTTVVAILEHGFHAVAGAAGLLPPGDPRRFLVLYRRRLYLNLSLSMEVGSRLPGVSGADAERLVLGGGASEASSPRIAPRALPLIARVVLGILRLERRLPGDIERARKAVERLPERSDIEGADPERLAGWLRAFLETGRDIATTHIATSGGSAFRLALLGRFLSAVAPGDAAARVNRLVAGLDAVESASPALALEALAVEARGRPEWSSWLSRTAAAAAAAFGRGEIPVGLGARLRAFLERFGHRALSEGELSAAAWEDDPTPVFGALRTLLSSQRSADFVRRARLEARRADEEAIVSRLGPLRRGVLRRLLRGAQDWVRRREETKSIAVALLHHARRLAHASARHLVARRALARAEDVFFLTFDELVAALEGQGLPGAALARRRRRHEREGALPAPRVVDLAKAEAEETAPGSGALEGTGVSAGIGAGPARVLQPGSPPHLEPGEVLVAPVLDAALGPLLAAAAAAVAEIGGMLSHGAVVARELGVPCVVDVREATRRIRTGDHVIVDGGSGRVRAWGPEDVGDAAGSGRSLYADVADPRDDAFHPLEDHPLARESVYFNVQDPQTGLAIVASLGVRKDRGEALLALSPPDGRVLFGLGLAPARVSPGGITVSGFSTSWNPPRLAFEGALAGHEGDAFPPAPLPLLLAPRTVRASVDLTWAPTTPAVDLCDGLPEDVIESLRLLGRHHVEQSGVWRGEVVVDGRRIAVLGTGSRDHSWGLRDWEAADHWRLFTARLGDDLAVHALAVVVRGRRVEGGFVWRGERAERITRVEFTTERDEGRLRALDLEVGTAAGPPLRLRGDVWKTITVPVDLERRPLRHLAGRPYRLLLHENYTRYEAEDRVGYGMAEFTERPQ